MNSQLIYFCKSLNNFHQWLELEWYAKSVEMYIHVNGDKKSVDVYQHPDDNENDEYDDSQW